jgi:hypothetical protein
MMNLMTRPYVQLSVLIPLLVGMLLGTLQTGLFFQLTFTLSSGFNTYLMVTLSWILGSWLGVMWGGSAKKGLPLWALLWLMLIVYAAVSSILLMFPFNSRLWVVYAFLIIFAGLYPGVFFARMSAIYTARVLFFWENNGFIIGTVASTLLFMMYGRALLWWLPLILSAAVGIAQIYAPRVDTLMRNTPTPVLLPEINEA